jgi:hypothetical protein
VNASEAAEAEDKATTREDLEARCAWNRERRLAAEKDAIALRAQLEKKTWEEVWLRTRVATLEARLTLSVLEGT